ncbi:MAG TPA: hypothetical protein V6C97_15830 [Oculatellaceae cyanobacterium]
MDLEGTYGVELVGLGLNRVLQLLSAGASASSSELGSEGLHLLLHLVHGGGEGSAALLGDLLDSRLAVHVLGEQVVAASTQNDLVVDIGDVHDEEHIVSEVVRHDAAQNIERHLHSAHITTSTKLNNDGRDGGKRETYCSTGVAQVSRIIDCGSADVPAH